MDDVTAALQQCQEARGSGQVIDHATARTIASWYQESDGVSDAFALTGTIVEPSKLWQYIIQTRGYADTDTSLYEEADQQERFMLECLAVYILTHGKRGPVAGWHSMWVRP
jgi:hypothetical protein